MKTQINALRSGNKNQRLNKDVDYSKLSQSTLHNGHCGTSQDICEPIWDAVKQENKENIKFMFLGKEHEAKANWSMSGKSVIFTSLVGNSDFEDMTGYKVSRGKQAYISIQGATNIILSNGGRYYCYVCPSLITIL